ncbi:MAG: 23S rRNA (adenine(2030)-N(6))-methyltransferase RlmJ [Hyphomonadaceae bacterium]|nr:23S rRNA (adenine(2030)-N(6))-methyltransferase RlmJ [Hyphomonadaceae bacterium]
MNYRHGFHVGNHGDVLKHAALLYCIERLKLKKTPFAVLDTHAGAGLYDLSGPQAQRSPEWQGGIGRIWDWNAAPPLVASYLEAVRAFNPDGTLGVYPGSPALAARALRAHDTLIAVEKHPEEAALLRESLAGFDHVRLHMRDAWEALPALLPPREKRGLVLIDPPYEQPDELEVAARALGPALKRFGHGVYLWWRPLKSASALGAADAEARTQGARETLRADLWIDTPQPEGRLVGSSLLLINPPFGLEAALREALPPLAQKLAAGAAGWRVSSSQA